MSLPNTALVMSAFSLGGTSFLGLLKTFTMAPENTLVDGAGLSMDAEYNVPVKQKQSIDFTLFQDNSVPLPASNLDVSVFTIGGTNYLTSLKGGQIDVSITLKDGSPVNSAYEVPVPTRRGVEIRTDLMVFSTAAMTELMMNGTQDNFSVVVALTLFGEAIIIPMVLSSSSYKVDRGEIQMENVVFKMQGPATGPSDTSLLGVAIYGTGLIAVSADTGVETFETASGQKCAIESISASFNDAALIELTGKLRAQGALTLASA